MPDNTPTAKPRKKATTEVGRSIMQRERQRMAREQAALGEALVKESQLRQAHATEVTTDVEHNAISRGIVRRISYVLASEGVNAPIYVKKGQAGVTVNAWTDFKVISVTYQPLPDKRIVAASLRGAVYHEGGHIRFTPPPQLLWDQVKDSGIKPESYSGDLLGIRSVFHAWNLLEDQRMETAVVSDSPRKAAYLAPLIMTELANTPSKLAANYPLMIWRRYLPRTLRAAARRMFVARHNMVGKDGEALAQRCEVIVDSYVLATTAVELWQAVCDMHDLLKEMEPTTVKEFGHDKQPSGLRGQTQRSLDDYLIIPVDGGMCGDGCGPEQDEEPEQEPEIDQTDPEVAEFLTALLIAMFWHPETLVPVAYANTNAAPQEPQDDAAPRPSSQDQDEQEEGSKGDDESGDGGGDEAGDEGGDHGGADDFGQDDIDKMLQDAKDERDEMSELDADMRAFADAREQDSQLEVYVGGISSDGAAVGKAVSLAEEIERSFRTHTMDKAPSWVEGQRRGMLNVLRYETRRPGDVEVFRQWTDDEQPGFDMAVSILLDYSGSMDCHVVRLAQAAFASKVACQNLGIPCTVTLWDTNAKVLWDARERAEGMPTIKDAGGTDPTVALLDLDNQRLDKAKHIVLIMTDGEWNGTWAKRTLAAYKEPGRSLFGFGLTDEVGDTWLARKLLGYGCDDAVAITDLMAIPHHLEQFLVGLA